MRRPYRSIAVDISAKVRAVAGGRPNESDLELLASRNHYRRVVQALSEGVFVQDRSGKILSVNSAAAKILGMDVTTPARA